MKNFYTLLLALSITGLGFSQTTIYSQDFETNLSGYSHTPSQTPATDAGDQYFHRAEPSDGTIYESGGPYTNVTGSWLFVGSNPKTFNGGASGELSFGSIDVTGYSDLVFSADFGGVPNDWDASDELSVEYSWDNSTWDVLYSFSSPVTNDPLELENNATGGVNTANGTVLTYALQTITSDNFIGSGTTLYLKIVCNSNANYEAFGVDNIILEGTSGGGCTAPTTQASAYNTTSLATTSATLNWTSGDGDEVIVVVKESSAVDTDPTDGTSYTGNTAFTSGDQIGTGNYVVQSGSATSSVSVTGLSPATTYHLAVYEYNTLDTCYLTPALTGSFTTDCSTPTDVSAMSATAGNTTTDISWTNGSCFDEILVVARASSAVTATPTGDGTAYTADSTFGSGTDIGTSEFVVYKGTGTSVTVNSLTNGTEYHYTVFARKGTSWSTGVSDSATPNAAPVAGDIVISEIMYNSSGTDDEWIEIYNGSGSDITLNSDWRLTYGGSTFDFSGTLITDGSYLTIALGSNGDGTYNNDNPFTPDVSIIGTPAANTDDSNNLVNSTTTIAIIYDPSGSNVTIDTVTYDDGSPWPTNPDGNGPSLELVDVTSDNSLAASWAASDNDGGTPGTGYPVTYTFTGTWSPSDPNGSATAGDDIVIASGNATINSNTTCNSVTVNAGAGLTVDTGITLTTTNGLALESNSTSYSSLILDGTVTGTLTYERHVNVNGSGETGSNDLISAPLTGQEFDDFVLANSNILNNGTLYLFGHFDKTTAEYLTYAGTSTTTLDAGVGYRAASSDNSTFTFTGTANNGVVSIDITNGGPSEPEWNLVGNPYPSYINVQDFLNHEVSTGVSNLSLFDFGTAAIYGYDGTALDGWITYNLASTTASTLIAPGQGFFVSADATNAPLYDLEFTPAMRSTGTTDDFISGRNAQLLYVKVNASTNINSFTAEIYFNNNASQGFDLGYDAEVWGETIPDFAIYSHLIEDNQGSPIKLQALNTSDISDTTIPLGVNANQGEQLTFSITETTLLESTNIYLDDVVANTSTLLNNSDYVITPTTNLSGTGRFFLRTSQVALSTIENNLDALNIYALNKSKELIVSGQLQENSKLELYDIQGRKVLSTQLDTTNLENRIDVSILSEGIYVVTIENSRQQKTQKVILK